MYSLSIYTFNGNRKLCFIQTHKPNGYVTITDKDNNSKDVHNRYVTDLTNYPQQQQKALSMYNYIKI